MSWLWIAATIGVPTLAGLLVAVSFWLVQRDATLGNVVGGGAILICVLAIFGLHYGHFQQLLEACRAGRAPCPTFMDQYRRYCSIGALGFLDIAALFLIGLAVERRLRRP